MEKRRANGEGNLRKRKDGWWEEQYTEGRAPETEKTIYKNVLGRTQAEAKAKLKEAIEMERDINTVKSKKYAVGEWMNEWFEELCQKSAPVLSPDLPGVHRQLHSSQHRSHSAGKAHLSRLAEALQEAADQRPDRQSGGQGTAKRPQRQDGVQILSSALKLAQEQRIILTNPAEVCALPKVEQREMKTLPVEQPRSFLRKTRESGVFELYYLELATGLRRGELLGLKWGTLI